VLIEIGAAMALFGRHFILLVREGVSVPPNLDGLYQVRYSGDTLDGETTIRLLEVINEMKKQRFLVSERPRHEPFLILRY
jgi:predicted nucleotide-binding protein